MVLSHLLSRYRKHFRIPKSWQGSYIDISFEAIFHLATIYLNGELIGTFPSGYTEVRIRLDNMSHLQYGNTTENVLVVRADSSYGSGHWYEGGGLYRHIWLTRDDKVHIAPHGIYSSSELPEDGHGYVSSRHCYIFALGMSWSSNSNRLWTCVLFLSCGSHQSIFSF